jgi:hypothetical protein
MSIRIIVADTNPSHGAGVKAAISTGYGSDISADIEIYAADLGSSIAYAQSIGAIAVVHSYVGIENHVAEAQLAYPAIQCFMPLGSNSFIELFNLTSIPVIVSCGAGLTQNDTAYGLGLEFWDSPDFVSSNSTGVVCGKILKIKDTLSCTWWEARYRARQTSGNNGVWDKFNGYGQISVAAANAFAGSIAGDPYLAPPVPSVIARLQGVDFVSPALESVSVE